MSSIPVSRGIGRTPTDMIRTRRAIQRLRTRNLVLGDGLTIGPDGEIQVAAGQGLAIAPDGSLRVILSEVEVLNERPAGAINGVNDTFTLANEPLPGTTRVFLNGVFMADSGDDYTFVSTNMIVFEPDQIPQTGDRLVAHYHLALED
jgi:hypothetical protein